MEHIARAVQRQQALQQVALQQCYDLLLNVQNRYSPCSAARMGPEEEAWRILPSDPKNPQGCHMERLMLKRMLHRIGEGVLNSSSKESSPAGTSAAFLVCWSARTCTPQMPS